MVTYAYDFFVLSSPQDREQSTLLAHVLRENGYAVADQHEFELEAWGQDGEVVETLLKARSLRCLLLLTPQLCADPCLSRSFRPFLERAAPGGERAVIPVKLAPCTLPEADTLDPIDLGACDLCEQGRQVFLLEELYRRLHPGELLVPIPLPPRGGKPPLATYEGLVREAGRRPALLCRYHLLEPLSLSRDSDVYLGYDRNASRIVAIKRVREGAIPPGRRAEALRYREDLLSLRNGPLPLLFDQFIEGDDSYLVTEYLAGAVPLAAMLSYRCAPLPPAHALVYGLRLCSAVAWLHERGVVGSVTPGNLLLNRLEGLFVLPRTTLHLSNREPVVRDDLAGIGAALYALLSGEVATATPATLEVRGLPASFVKMQLESMVLSLFDPRRSPYKRVAEVAGLLQEAASLLTPA